MELTEDLTYDTGRLFSLAAVGQSEAVHSEEDSALNRLKAVAGVRQSTRNDNGHRVVDVGRSHFMVNLYRLDNSVYFFYFFVLHIFLKKSSVFQVLYKHTNLAKILGENNLFFLILFRMQTQVSQELLKIISYARDEAMRTGDYSITTDHLLLGILRHSDNDACASLKALGVDLAELKVAIEGSIFRPSGIAYHEADKLSFSRSAQNTLNLCIIEATMSGADKIFSTHLLLAIAASSGSVGLGYLKSMGLNHSVLSDYLRKNGLLAAKSVDAEENSAASQPMSILRIISSPDKIAS